MRTIGREPGFDFLFCFGFFIFAGEALKSLVLDLKVELLVTLPRIDEKDADVLVLEFRERLLCVLEVFTRNLVASYTRQV